MVVDPLESCDSERIRRLHRRSCDRGLLLDTRHPDEVVGGECHLHPYLVPQDADEAQFPCTGHRLQPAEGLLDAFPDTDAHAIAGVSRGALVNRTRTASRRRPLCNVRRDPELPATGDKSLVVLPAVTADGLSSFAGYRIEEHQRRYPFRRAARLRQCRVDDEPVAIVHQRVSDVGKPRRLTIAFPG